MKLRLTGLSVLGTAVLMGITPAAGQAAPLSSCSPQLSPGQIGTVGHSCKLAPNSTVRVGGDLIVQVPARDTVASVAVLSTGKNNQPSELSVFRSKTDRLSIQIDQQPVRGDKAAAAVLNRALRTREPEGSESVELKELGPCGSPTYYTSSFGVWPGGVYRWSYNSKTQPNSGALEAIQYGFKFITDDSSNCGTAPTDATHSYRGASTKYTWGARDTYNTVGWAGFGPTTLGVTYSYWDTSTGYRVEADIAFNNRNKNWSTSLAGSVPSGRYDVISVATHEAGHAFGLSHFGTKGNEPTLPFVENQVMYPSIGTGVNKRLKRSGDLAGMAAKY